MNYKNIVKIAKQIIAQENNHEKDKTFIKDFIDSFYFKEFPDTFETKSEKNTDLEKFYKFYYGNDKNAVNRENFLFRLSGWLKKKQMYYESEINWLKRYLENKNDKVPSNDRIKINLMKSDFAG